MGDVDASIYSISGAERGLDMNSGRNRQSLPPAVVITHDSDTYSPPSINPSSGEGLLSYKDAGGLGSSTLSLATEGRNGVFGPPSRAGSPRHSKIHPTDGSSLPKSGSSMAVFSTENQLLGMEGQLDHSDLQKKSSHCCSGRAKKTAIGFFLTVIICGTWVGITHLLKWAYLIHLKPLTNDNSTTETDRTSSFFSTPSTAVIDMATNRTIPKPISILATNKDNVIEPFKAPFITTWFCTAINSLFFPVYLCTRFCSRRTRTTAKRSILDSMRRFREKGLSALHFLIRSTFFCVLWVGTNYMFIYAVSRLDATAVMALQASSASFIYLLSWVILHEQFVGIRIVAVILCNTGIALLAYMDGVSRTQTLGGVVMASAAAAGLAVYRVLFRKLIGRVTMGQLSIFLTLVGLLNVIILWPIGLTLYLLKTEVLVWDHLPYIQIAGVAVLIMVANVLGNFDIIHNYDTFLRLGVVAAVPASAVLDVHLYNVIFEGMKLAGILLISIGFMLVLLPDNWPDYITRLIRWRCRKCPKYSKPTDPTQPKSRHLFIRPST